MAFFENTCDQLIERICRLVLFDWKEGTATSGSTSTLADTSRDEADDYFQNTVPISRIHVRTTTDALAPIGEDRRASDWALTGGVFTVAANFTVAPAAGDTYAILHLRTWEDIREAINSAIDVVKKDCLIEKIDEDSVALTADVYEYPVPTSLVYVYRLTMADGNGKFYGTEIDPTQYRIVRGSPTPKIMFTAFPSHAKDSGHWYGEPFSGSDFTASRKIRIEGLGTQDKLTKDTDKCYINPDFVVAQAGALLYAPMIKRSDTDPDQFATQFNVWQGIADKIKADTMFKTPIPPNSKRVQ